jgi:hypothetical protein
VYLPLSGSRQIAFPLRRLLRARYGKPGYRHAYTEIFAEYSPFTCRIFCIALLQSHEKPQITKLLHGGMRTAMKFTEHPVPIWKNK